MNPKLTVWFDRKIGRRFYRFHVRLYRVTGGRIGHRSSMGTMLLITTVGRKSGQPRTTPLLYMPDGGDFVVVASNGGRDSPPAWFLNLTSSPEAVVQVRRRHARVDAEILLGDDKLALWPRLTDYYGGWDYYQQLTERELPVVRLRPQDQRPATA